VRLKESIERDLGIPARIRMGSPGSLDIFADGEKVFSKKQAGRPPSAAEVVELLRGRM
jgi:hypothetical protein